MTATDNLIYKFGGMKVDDSNTRVVDKSNYVELDSGHEVIHISKEVYKHREDGLNFDYSYAVRAVDFFEATGDEQFDGTDKQFYIEILLFPMYSSRD